MDDAELHLKSKAQRILRDVGDEVISAFQSARPDAIVLNSKRDSVSCWEDGGLFHYVVVTQFSGPGASYSGPNAQGIDAPLLCQIRVNTEPPPQLYNYLEKSNLAPPETFIADEPYLLLHGRAQQISRLGAWVASWYECQRGQEPSPPRPPVKLVYNAVNKGADQPEHFRDIAQLGGEWLFKRDLWTESAAEDFFPWFQNR
jgi:hypothetical protein